MLQFNHHQLLLHQYGETRRVLYCALLAECTLKFGITDSPLKERVATHASNFRNFFLVGVFTGLQFPKDLETKLKKWAAENNILISAHDKRNEPYYEIIDLSRTPLFVVLNLVGNWAVEQMQREQGISGSLGCIACSGCAGCVSEEPSQNQLNVLVPPPAPVPITLPIPKAEFKDYFDFEKEGAVLLTDVTDICKRLKVSSETPNTHLTTGFACAKCKNLCGPKCTPYQKATFWLKGNWVINGYENTQFPICQENTSGDIFSRFIMENIEVCINVLLPVMEVNRKFEEWNASQGKDKYRGVISANRMTREINRVAPHLVRYRNHNISYYKDIQFRI